MAKSLFETNARAELQVDDSYMRDVLSGYIVGASNDSVAVRVADASGRPVGLMRGTKVQLSVQRLASHYTFDTIVLGTRSGPEPVLILERPRDEPAAGRRAHVRIDLLIAGARMVVGTGGKVVNHLTTVLDLSTGGAMVRTDQPVPVGARLLLTFPLPTGGANISADGLALRCSERPGSRGERTSYRTSVRFVGIHPTDQERIRLFILAREKQMHSRGVV